MTIHRKPQSVDEEAVRRMIREELPAALRLVFNAAIAAKPPTYSDRKGHGPPGYSAERAKERVRSCPYSVRRGRWHVVDREAFERWERDQLPAPAPASGLRAVPAWSPEAALAGAGLRATGGRR